MSVDCRFRGIDHSQSLVDYIHERVQKLSRYAPNGIRVQVSVSKEGHRHCIELNFTTPSQTFRARASSEDHFYSLDMAVEKILRQVKKRQQRLRNHRNYALHNDTLVDDSEAA